MQAERLPGATWHDGLDTLPDAPLVLLANEFLDALPIRQFVRRGGRWMERFVEEGRFVECEARPPPPNPLPQGEGEDIIMRTQRTGSRHRAVVGHPAFRPPRSRAFPRLWAGTP